MPEDNIQLPIGQLLGSGYGQGLLGAYGAGLPNGMQGTDVLNKFQQGVSQFQTPNSLVAPQDANVMQQPTFGASPELNKAGWNYGQPLGQPQSAEDKMAAMMQADQEQRRQQAAMGIMAKGIQGMAQGMKQQMPSANTAQIIRDNNQFRFAGTPQQQMANALRRR